MKGLDRQCNIALGHTTFCSRLQCYHNVYSTTTQKMKMTNDPKRKPCKVHLSLLATKKRFHLFCGSCRFNNGFDCIYSNQVCGCDDEPPTIVEIVSPAALSSSSSSPLTLEEGYVDFFWLSFMFSCALLSSHPYGPNIISRRRRSSHVTQ